MTQLRMTRKDLPQFTVTAVEQGEADFDGNVEWRLRGHLSRLEGATLDGWTWLLLPGRSAETGYFTEPKGDTHETTFAIFSRNKPELAGQSLACLNRGHQAYHVWMIEDGPTAWAEHTFVASDALAEIVIGSDGKRYQKWSKLQNTENGPPNPGADPAQEIGRTWVIPGGWDHEHCEICNAHIDPGDRHFYYAEFGAFLCVSCYEKYVVTGSIGFAISDST